MGGSDPSRPTRGRVADVGEGRRFTVGLHPATVGSKQSGPHSLLSSG